MEIKSNIAVLTGEGKFFRIGTTPQTVSRWLKGVNEPDLTTLLHLCSYVGETPNSLLGFDDITEQDLLSNKQIPR